MALELPRRSHPEPPGGASLAAVTRRAIRIVLLAAIAGIAALRGFRGERLLWLVIVVAWAAALPYLVRTVWRATSSLERRVRWAVTAGSALLLLAGFAFAAGRVLGAF